ncbi:MAG: acyltransferase family protein [Gemmatimonadaceae bacterium]
MTDERPRENRLIYVDQLRMFAVAAVLLIHVCEVFNPFDEWHIVNAERSRTAGEVVVIMAPWVMPLFMLLAGVSAWYSLQRRNNRGYLRERVLRVLLPLVVGTLVLVPPQVYLERRLRGQFDGSFWSFLPHFFDGLYPRGNFSWHHLWFLGHLFAYSLLALPLFRYLQGPAGQLQLKRVARVWGGPAGLIWLALPLVLERQLLWGLFPERHMLTSDWSNHALLFVAYVYGFVLAGEVRLGEAIDQQWPSALALALASSVLLIAGAWVGQLPQHVPPPYTLEYLTLWTLYAVAAWAWMVAVLGIGRRWLRHDTGLLRYSRRLGYAVYLVHQPVIIAVAFLVVQAREPIGVKFGVLLVVSIAGTLVGAELMSRLPLIGRVVVAKQDDVSATDVGSLRRLA